MNVVGAAGAPEFAEDADVDLGEDTPVVAHEVEVSSHAGAEHDELLEDDDVYVEVAGRRARKDEVELAHRAAELVEELVDVVTPRRVLLASLFMLALLLSGAWGWWSVLPRDAVTLEVVYMQAGPGQVVLAELHNQGSRGIEDISVEISLLDAEGVTLNTTRFTRDSLAAHTSVAGNDLEVIVEGVSGWAEYEIEVTLLYTDARGDRHTNSWNHEVGEWATERFLEKPDRAWWFV